MPVTIAVRKLYKLQSDVRFLLKTARRIERRHSDCLDIISTVRSEEAILNSYSDGALSPREWKKARDGLRDSRAKAKKRWQESQSSFRKLKSTLSHIETALAELNTLMKVNESEVSDRHRKGIREIESTLRLVRVIVARIEIQL